MVTGGFLPPAVTTRGHAGLRADRKLGPPWGDGEPHSGPLPGVRPCAQGIFTGEGRKHVSSLSP